MELKTALSCLLAASSTDSVLVVHTARANAGALSLLGPCWSLLLHQGNTQLRVEQAAKFLCKEQQGSLTLNGEAIADQATQCLD